MTNHGEATVSTDVLVIGSGAAGMAAALTAATHGASVLLAERAETVGGTSAVSGGIAWIPAHDRSGGDPLPVEDALAYLTSLSNGYNDPVLIDAFVRTGSQAIDFVEQHSDLQFEVAPGYPDYKPEHPGGRPHGGRSLSPLPYDVTRLPHGAPALTEFPRDFSNVGFDAETRARLNAGSAGRENIVVAGQALIAPLLSGVIRAGVDIRTGWRARALMSEDDRVTGARFETSDGKRQVSANAVILAAGGFEWDPSLVRTFLRGPMHGPVSPPNNTGDALKMAMALGAALGNMREAWWVPVIQIPGDTLGGQQRSRSVRLERTRPRSIMVNSDGNRFVNEAADYNSMIGAFHHIDVDRFTYPNDSAWIVFDHDHLDRYGFLAVPAGGEAPDWYNESPDLESLAAATGIDPAGLAHTVERWNAHAAALDDVDFHRGRSAYDGYWGDPEGSSTAEKTIGPIDKPPFFAVPVRAGAMGTKGGPLTDADARVQHIEGTTIEGLYAAGNAMSGPTGMAYGGAGGTIGPAMVFGFRAGYHAATGKSVTG